jgi:uncharacterized cupredoxin-like copper-binding protein
VLAPAKERAGDGAPARRPRRRLVWWVAVLAALTLAAGTLAAGMLLRPRGPRTVELVMRHSHFEPVTFDARPGETVTFVIRNADPIDHEFIVGDAAVHRRHEVGRERHHHGDVPGEVSVAAGAEGRTTFRFPATAGPVEFACHLPGHYAYGMHGVVQVRG